VSIRLFSVHLKVPILLLLLIEALLYFFSTFLAFSLLVRPDWAARGTLPTELWPTGLIFAIFGCIGTFAMGLYSMRQRSGRAGLALRLFAGHLVAGTGCALLFYFFPSLGAGPGVLGLTVVLAILSSVIARLLFERIVDQDLFKRRVMVFGAGQRASTLLELRRRVDQRGFRLVAFIATEGDTVTAAPERLTERPDDLYRWACKHEIDEIVIAMDDRRQGFPVHELLECRLAGIEIVDLATFLERETGKVRLDLTSPSWFIFGQGFRVSPWQQALERGFDLLASLGLLIIAAPAMALTVLAIKLEDGRHAPVLYRQRRVGQHGGLFDVLKFRSMRVDAEKPGEARWAVRNDPRITRVGNVIRKTRLDELPQLFNVLRGDMSFVGPRPERPEFVEHLEQTIPYYRERHTVKPGITGWAQLCYPYGASEKDAREKLQYDLYYVKNRSLIFDLAILLQTVEVVLWSKGAR
jgi:sugar transferase (PEP-CTERM system associated)